MSADISINGSMGFYTISASSEIGRAFLVESVQGFDGDLAYCDDTRMTQDIADGAVAEGLGVEVNGNAYEGERA